MDTTVTAQSAPNAAESVSRSGVIAGAVLGGLAFLLIVICVIVCCCVRARKRQAYGKNNGPREVLNAVKPGNHTTNPIGNGIAVPTIVSSVESTSPVILDPRGLDTQERVVLNQSYQAPSSNSRIAPAAVQIPPPDVPSITTTSGPREVLNYPPLAPAAPIVPQQASLLYPTLPNQGPYMAGPGWAGPVLAPTVVSPQFAFANPVSIPVNSGYMTYAQNPIPAHMAAPAPMVTPAHMAAPARMVTPAHMAAPAPMFAPASIPAPVHAPALAPMPAPAHAPALIPPAPPLPMNSNTTYNPHQAATLPIRPPVTSGHVTGDGFTVHPSQYQQPGRPMYM